MEREEPVRSLLLSLANFAGCVHSGRTLVCSPHGTPPGYAYAMTPLPSKGKVLTMMKRRRVGWAPRAFLQTAPAAEGGTWAVQHSWDEDGQREARSGAWQGTFGWCWSYPPCGP